MTWSLIVISSSTVLRVMEMIPITIHSFNIETIPFEYLALHTLRKALRLVWVIQLVRFTNLWRQKISETRQKRGKSWQTLESLKTTPKMQSFHLLLDHRDGQDTTRWKVETPGIYILISGTIKDPSEQRASVIDLQSTVESPYRIWPRDRSSVQGLIIKCLTCP